MKKNVALARPLRVATLSLAGCAALALGGCSNGDKVAELEQRLATVEAKADAAEKRAKAAESFASRNAPQPFPAESTDNITAPDMDPDNNNVTDDSANDPSFNNDIEPPPPAPMIPGDA